MRFQPYLALGLLLAGPALSRAQTLPAPTAPAPSFYVGLGAYHSNYQNLATRYGETGFRVPVQLVAGYQLRPRLALELGAAYSGRTSPNAYEAYYFDASGKASYYQLRSTTTVRTTTVSALARYALTRQAARRLQFDMLGGFGLVHAAGTERGTYTDDLSGSLQTKAFARRGSSTNWLLTVGLATRYRLSARFGLNFDIATNRDLTYPDFIGSAALGVRYRLGR